MYKLFYSIGEIAGILGESTSLVRFWANSFPKFIRPVRNAKGNRMFSEEDVETFKQIHYLVRNCGLSLEGAAKKLKEDRAAVAAEVRILESLKNIRAQLVEVRMSLMKRK